MKYLAAPNVKKILRTDQQDFPFPTMEVLDALVHLSYGDVLAVLNTAGAPTVLNTVDAPTVLNTVDAPTVLGIQ